MVLTNLSEVAHDQGDDRRAVALGEESLALFRALDEKRGIAHALTYLGGAARARGEDGRALALYKEALALYWHVGELSQLARCLEGLAEVLQALGQARQGTRFLAAAGALRERIGAPLPPANRPEHEQMVAALDTALGPDFSAAWQTGATLPLEQVVDAALALDGTTTQTPPISAV
jgi:tetratricopeptide (TPR) repeat protein